MKRFFRILVVMLALTGCTASTGFDPMSDLDPGAIALAKADGAFGAQEIAFDQRVQGEAGGSAFSLYAMNLGETDELRITVNRTSGDLKPSAYLYRGTETFVEPVDYETRDGFVTLSYRIAAGGEHHIVVKAYEGRGNGAFELSVECTGGTCRGIPADPLQRQSRCIQQATRCAIDDLPRWNGRVADARSRSIFNGCLDAQEDQACRTACDDEGAPVCGEAVSRLPFLADQSTACHAVLNECMDRCTETSGFYTADSVGETAAMACWTGYNGNCAEFIADHQACGGSEYATGTVAECRARCGATEGAWDEGPWDGCMEECHEIARQHDDFIREVAREAGEYVELGSSSAFTFQRFADMPEDVHDRVQSRIEQFAEEAMRDGRTDYGYVSDEKLFTITRDGEVVGYMVAIEYAIDDTLFDGGGQNLYFNLEADIVSDETFWG